MAVSLLAITTTAAEAATYSSTFSVSAPSNARTNGQVTVSGRLLPVTPGRAVSLYSGVAADGSGGSWIAGTSTDANGYFSFTTTVGSATRFKFFSAKHAANGHTYLNTASAPFVVGVAPTRSSTISEVSTPATTNVNGQVVLRGRVLPSVAGRSVSLYRNVNTDGSGGEWAAGTQTDANGYFSFTTSVTAATRFKFFSAKQDGGWAWFEHTSHGPFTVSPGVYDTTIQVLYAPQFTGVNSTTQVVLGQVIPSVAGRQVSLYRNTNFAGEGGTFVKSTTTDANGWFMFNTDVESWTTFKFFSAKHIQNGAVHNHAKSAVFDIRATKFLDDFSYNTVDEMLAAGKGWYIRGTGDKNTLDGNPSNGRSTGAADAVTFGTDATGERSMKLWVKANGDGTYRSGHVARSMPDFVYGGFTARVKLPKPEGALASLWHQAGYAPRQAGVRRHELDVFETMGEKEPSGALKPTVHTVYDNGASPIDRTKPGEVKEQVGAGFFDQYQTIEAYWFNGGYWYRVGQGSWKVLETGGYSGNVSGELILSMLVPDYMLDKLNPATLGSMKLDVDWVRTWK